jgi:limonene 1,2-monooxygenase
VIGTPDDMVAMIHQLQATTGGFGVVLGFAHDWADREATMRSWELFARYVIPELTGSTRNIRASQRFLHDHRTELMSGASRAVMSKIMAHEGAAAAMATTMEQIARDKT